MLRCLIYKVHAALSGGSLFYHLVSPLSSTSFKFFQTFFSAFPRENLRLTPWPPSRTTCLYYHLSQPLSSAFFQIFFNLFSRLTRSGREFSAALADSLCRIPHPSPVVKHFFPLFRSFSFLRVFSLIVRVQRTFLHEILSCAVTPIMIP